MYNKLFTKILDSSIWLEPLPVRIVWVTFLAMMDQDGTVALSGLGNVANRARVSEQDAEEAIRVLESPDERNPGQELDGRRIERIPGIGWMVLNSSKYRDVIRADEMRAKTRERVRRHRCNAPVTQCNVLVTPSDAGAQAGTEAGEGKNPPPPHPCDGMDKDETPIELAKPMAKEINWRDWRLTHGKIHVGPRGDDGDTAAWEALFNYYGLEVMDGMYKRLLKKTPDKRIYFNIASEFLEANTTEVTE